MDQLGRLMGDAIDQDAARSEAHAFADRRGAATAGRVRRRRGLRAAGLGMAGVVAAGVVGFGGIALVGDRDPVPAGDRACVPVDDSVLDLGLREPGPDAEVLSGSSEQLRFSLTEHALTVTRLGEPGDTVVLAVEDHQLAGVTRGESGMVEIEFPSGETAVVDLDWEGESIEVSYGVHAGVLSTTGSFPADPAELREGPRFYAFDLRAMIEDDAEDPPTWVLLDVWAGASALHVEGDPATGARVVFPDGSAQDVTAGGDGVLAFTWAGVTDMSIDAQGEAVWGDEVMAPIDAVVSGPQLCLD